MSGGDLPETTVEELVELLEAMHLVDLEPRVQDLRDELVELYRSSPLDPPPRVGSIVRLLAVMAPAADRKRAHLFPLDVDRNAGPS